LIIFEIRRDLLADAGTLIFDSAKRLFMMLTFEALTRDMLPEVLYLLRNYENLCAQTRSDRLLITTTLAPLRYFIII
jgi:hypothetical protein